MNPVLRLDDVSVQFNTHVALQGVRLDMHAGERIALVGANAVSYTHLTLPTICSV